jgi:superfamily I DNA/RNA helicase
VPGDRRPDHDTRKSRRARWRRLGARRRRHRQNQDADRRGCPPHRGRRRCSWPVLAVTFTNKATTETSSRIPAALDGGPAPSWIRTFHGLAARQLRIEPEIAALRPGFDILDADDSRRIVRRALKALNLASGDGGTADGRDPLKLMCGRLSKFKDNLITPHEAPAQVEAPGGLPLI